MSTGQPSPKEYRLQSPGEGVYRVVLEDIGTGTAAQAFFTGHNAVETVRLPPGNYVSAITDVGRNLVVSGERITLPDEGGFVTLPQFPDAAPQSSAPPSIAPAGIDTRASTMTSRSAARSTNRPVRRHSPATKKGYSSRPVVPEGVPVGTDRHGLRFDAALSEDIAPGSIGGWRAPSGLRVTKRRLEESGGLSIDVEDDLEVRRSRLRLTVGIEGRPALRIPLPLFRGGVSVAIKPFWTARGPDVQVEVAARDVRVQGLLVALGDLNPDEAASVVTWASGTKADAVEVLAQKSQDLWAAATAAIVLTRIGQLEQVADWTHNLTRLAPHIADAGVVAAWATLGFGDGPVEKLERRAIELLQRSARAGAPTFAMGNSLLLEVLANLRVSSIEKRSARIADVEYRRATRRSRFRVFRSPLMIWEQEGEQLKGGRLRGSRYASVVHGTLVGQSGAARLILPR